MFLTLTSNLISRQNCQKSTKIKPCPVALSENPSRLNEQLFDAKYCMNLCVHTAIYHITAS